MKLYFYLQTRFLNAIFGTQKPVLIEEIHNSKKISKERNEVQL